jgi:uncharacterized membrane protein YfcA
VADTPNFLRPRMAYWLMKIEPDECSVDDLSKLPRQTVPWTGVRNYQARNFMRDQMKVGDGVLYYHSSCPEPGVAGIAEVASPPYPDATQFDPKHKYYDRAGVDAPAAAREPAVDHAGDRRRMACGHAPARRVTIEPLLVAKLVLLGCGTGFLAGLLGIGGGMLMVPFLTLMLSHRGVPDGVAVKLAIATSMATILFTSLSSVRAHHRRGAVRWDIVRGMAPGIVAGGLLAGAGAFALIKGQVLALVFALFVGFSATQMLLNRKPAPSRQMPGPLGRVAVGTGIGFLSGLVGAGGGFVSVPFMTWCNVAIHHAVATSAALGFPIALANTVGYVIGGWSEPSLLPGQVGYLYLPALAIIATASVLTAPLGARAAHAMNVRQLKRAFALLLYALAAYMLYKAVG